LNGVTLTDQGELRVGAHVLIQLGSELVTDAEQALLECVKNAYDADASGCRVEVDTEEKASRTEVGTAGRIARFVGSTETVTARIENLDGKMIDPNGEPRALVRRHLEYMGRITIEDDGAGIPYEELQNSWLVVSGSAKRVDGDGPKRRTSKGRTPLGDKGLGRLGTMKLGDILLVESATSRVSDIASAQFRWRDCEDAETVDQIPVALERRPNIEGFKGTRVSVLGLADLAEWRRPSRLGEVTRTLAKLISPFEATSTFPVSVTLDRREETLGMVTEEVLSRAVAQFEFDWGPTVDGGANVLHSRARLRKRLLAQERSDKQRERTAAVFGADGGEGFATTLRTSRHFVKSYDEVKTNVSSNWFVELEREEPGERILQAEAATADDPGPFRGAFYFFFLVGSDSDLGEGVASGTGVRRQLVRDMAGIAVLRDGFQIRSRGDWLELSSGMTSGSTYNMRVDNTIGYFALTGSKNSKLVEKSDREGFVEDAAYRGFLRIARRCRDFANSALVDVRRSVDAFYAKQEKERLPLEGSTVEGALATVGDRIARAQAMSSHVSRATARLSAALGDLEGSDISVDDRFRALNAARNAVDDLGKAREDVDPIENSIDLLRHVRREVEEGRERAAALLESAAVGLAARGLTHELRTHLGEIQQRTTALSKKVMGRASGSAHADILAIRRACSGISQAAALIDPMLPRSRAVKDTFALHEFIDTYFAQRASMLARWNAIASVKGAELSVRINRPRLLQVLDNLVRNSMFWMRREAAEGSSGMISVEIVSDGFIVSDNGPGVDPRLEETLFELFVTGRHQEEGGQGLGLFIASELLALDGCSIELMPERNASGRRFRFKVALGAVTTGRQRGGR
jgi:signal transduction histidine kinase